MPDAGLLIKGDQGDQGDIGGQTRVSKLLRSGHAVVLDLAEAVPDDLPLPSRVDLVRGSAATGSEDPGAAVLLIRPDGYVAWATDNPADCADLLRSAIAESIAVG